MDNDFNIYNYFDVDEMIPTIPIASRSTDKFENWVEGTTTYDMLSYKYYGTSLQGRIIYMGNPEYINEFMIPDGKVIRIPFPFNEVTQELVSKITIYKSE